MADKVKLACGDPRRGGGLLGSQKLRELWRDDGGRRVEVPVSAVAALTYPWFLTLGVGTFRGVFEDDAEDIATTFRGAFAPPLIREILDALESVGLVVRYTDREGRRLVALTNYQGWGNEGAGRYEPPAGHHDAGATFNVPDVPFVRRRTGAAPEPVRAAAAPVVTEEPQAPPVVAPEPAQGASGPPPYGAANQRELIEFWRKVWGVARPSFGVVNLKAAERCLRACPMEHAKVAIWLARYGVNPWYREHNHAFEYLTRPVVVEKVISQNERFRLGPETESLALEHGVTGTLRDLRLGSAPRYTAPSEGPRVNGTEEDQRHFLALAARLRAANVMTPSLADAVAS